MFQLEFEALTHQGRVRRHNEDSIFASQPVFVVADGVGGSAAGEVASGMVIDEFAQLAGKQVSEHDVSDALVEAHRRVLARNAEAGTHAATTAVGAAVITMGSQHYWLFFNIGDSRAFRRVGGFGQALVQVSVDHSRVQELLDAGVISRDQAATHPERNVVTRAIGAEMDIEPDYWLMPVRTGERIVLCSDGLLNDSPIGQVKFLIKEVPGAANVARQLVDLALQHGARDNVSVIVIDVLEANEIDMDDVIADTVLTARRTP